MQLFQNKPRLIGVIAIVAVAVAAVTATSFAIAGGGDDSQPITGEALQQASDAALAATGGGRVTETEVGDEDSYYEVEVTLDDGSQVDVQLDESFNVVSQASDDDHGEADGADDDGENGDD